ncbi:MAG TPA: hypothetical protein VEL77_04950, partial [Rugosimonospora sp.]|nr:hypothetical protein [Rugosimonospora sp.]
MVALCLIALATLPCRAQQENQPSGQPQASGSSDAEFLRAADEVLAEMSRLLSLPVREPLKKSVRSREE